MADVPELVTNWKKVAWTVITSIRANAATVAPAIQRDLYPDNPEGTQVLDGYLARAASLQRKLDVLEACAIALLGELGDNKALGEELDRAAAAVRDRVIRTRLFAEGTYDPATLTMLGLTGETPRDPVALKTFAANAAGQLRTAPLPAAGEDEENEGATFDPARRAELIEQALVPLDTAIQAIAQDRRQDQSAMRARNEAEEDLRHAYIAAADLFAADAVAAGHRDIADRVRTTARRREGLPEPTDTDDGTETT